MKNEGKENVKETKSTNKVIKDKMIKYNLGNVFLFVQSF